MRQCSTYYVHAKHKQSYNAISHNFEQKTGAVTKILFICSQMSIHLIISTPKVHTHKYAHSMTNKCGPYMNVF